ncbi:MAG: efflux RND transporter permease subunit [Desulfobacterales bacterium]|nr:efflux RND transporter permease subunit [Desulfobacterales bacterium]
MKKILTTFVKYPFYAKVAMALTIILGLIAVTSMKKSSYPQVDPRTLSISVTYIGASVKEVEESVTSLIEDAIRGIPGVKEISSVSKEDYAYVSVLMHSDSNHDQVLYEVKNAIDGISGFPTDADRPVVSRDRGSSEAMYISLWGRDLFRLKEQAQKIEDDFLASGIISQVYIDGYPGVEISVEVKEEILRRYRLSIEEIRTAISYNNLDISAGMIKNDREEIQVLSRNRSLDPEDIGNIVIRAHKNGQLLRVSDVADVIYQFEEKPVGSWGFGADMIMISIYKLNNEDLAAMSKFVAEYVKKFQEEDPTAGIEVIFDYNEVIDNNLSILYENGAVGIFLVVLSLTLFLRFRLSLWVAWGIPASFLGLFMLANLFGITLNEISLFGMILIIGILVDDGIVVAENIYAHHESGKPFRKAAVDGTCEIIPAVYTSVFTTIIAFLPILFLRGDMEYFHEMALVVILCLSFSLIECSFLLPAHIANPKVFKKSSGKNITARARNKMDGAFTFLRDDLYIPLAKKCMKYRWICFSIPIAMVILTTGLLLSGGIGITFYPSVEDNSFQINLALKPGTNPEVTKSYLHRIDNAVWSVNADLREEFNSAEDFVYFTEVDLGEVYEGWSEAGGHVGVVFVFLADMKNPPISSGEIKARVYEEIGEIPSAHKFSMGYTDWYGAPVSVSLLGDNLKELNKARGWFINELKKYTALYNITDNGQVGSQEILLKLKPLAYALGLNQVTLMDQVRQAFWGAEAQRLQDGKDEVRVYVRYPKSNRINIGQLEKMRIYTEHGEYPLAALADYTVGRSPVAINRYNGQREIRVDAYMKEYNDPVPPILNDIETNVLPELMEKFPGITYTYQGQQKSTQDDITDMKKYYAIAFLGIVLLIMFHFRSLSQAIIILSMIPLGWLGAIWGHGIMGVPLSMMSLLGMIALSGTIVNDSVIFLAKYNQNLQWGRKISDAIIEAGRARFRPILLTSVTTVLGLISLVFETDPSALYLVPVAISIAFGIFFGTIFTVIFLPVWILTFNDFKRIVHAVITRSLPDAEEVEPAIQELKLENGERL